MSPWYLPHNLISFDCFYQDAVVKAMYSFCLHLPFLAVVKDSLTTESGGILRGEHNRRCSIAALSDEDALETMHNTTHAD